MQIKSLEILNCIVPLKPTFNPIIKQVTLTYRWEMEDGKLEIQCFRRSFHNKNNVEKVSRNLTKFLSAQSLYT
jgi:hypothetical protein